MIQPLVLFRKAAPAQPRQLLSIRALRFDGRSFPASLTASYNSCKKVESSVPPAWAISWHFCSATLFGRNWTAAHRKHKWFGTGDDKSACIADSSFDH
jgi:hypothetical protein